MAYTKQTWVNGSGGGTPISAARLTHIEDGIAAASSTFKPEDYGAVGDGTTDDTTAIQNCINAAIAASAVAYFAPGKTYKISSALIMGTATTTERWTIEGHGAILLQATNNTPILKFTNSALAHSWRIIGLGFKWSSNQSSSNTLSIAIYFDGNATTNPSFYNGEIGNIYLHNGFRGIATNEGATHPPTIWGTDIHNVYHTELMTGACIRLKHASAGMPNNSFRHIYIRGDLSTETVLEVSQQYNLVMENIELNNCVGLQIFMETCSAVEIIGIRTESCSTTANMQGLWWFSNVRARISGIHVQSLTANVANWAFLIRATYALTSLEISNVSMDTFTITSGEFAFLQAPDVADIQFTGSYFVTGTVTKLYPWDDTALHIANDRDIPKIVTVASSATPTINTDLCGQFNITALAAAITSMTTNLSGTPRDGQPLDIRFKDNGTARAITWGTKFTGTLLSTTVANKTHLQRLKWDATISKWAGFFADATGY